LIFSSSLSLSQNKNNKDWISKLLAYANCLAGAGGVFDEAMAGEGFDTEIIFELC
jgi:hypothetical protein